MTKIHFSSLIVVGAVTAVSTLFSSRAPAASSASDVAPVGPSKEFACGDKGKPPCPMQGWMKANMAPAAANGDADALAKNLDYVAKHAPAGYADWAKIAKEGMEAAKKKDIDGAKKSCKSCHDMYKAKYKEEMRDAKF